MIYESDLIGLLTTWKAVLFDKRQPKEYKDGVSDCIYDLQQLINNSFEEEMNTRADEIFNYLPSEEVLKHLDELAADEYNSSMEKFERAS